MWKLVIFSKSHFPESLVTFWKNIYITNHCLTSMTFHKEICPVTKISVTGCVKILAQEWLDIKLNMLCGNWLCRDKTIFCPKAMTVYYYERLMLVPHMHLSPGWKSDTRSGRNQTLNSSLYIPIYSLYTLETVYQETTVQYISAMMMVNSGECNIHPCAPGHLSNEEFRPRQFICISLV